MKLNEVLAAPKETPLELKDIIDSFPKHHPEALKKLWGGKRLVWNGDQFFADDKLGSAYEKAEKAVEECIRDGYTVQINIPMNVGNLAQGATREEDIHFEAEVDDKQEVYLGYSAKKDCLYIGYDAWLREEGFNEAFDKTFEELTGVPFDHDDDAHEKILKACHDEWKDTSMVGLLFKITHKGANYDADDVSYTLPGGFYDSRGTYKHFKAGNKDVVDLRLD